jgi:hypothetical protein
MLEIPKSIDFEDYLLFVAEDIVKRFGETRKAEVLALGASIVAIVKRP